MSLSIPIRTIGTALFFALASCGGGEKAPRSEAPKEQPATGEVALKITTRSGQNHNFTVELAVTEQEQERGLMERASLPDNHGMLFPFAFPATASFWMKNTPLPLDLLFIRPDGTIAAILPGKPNDLHPISAGEPVSAVLEIAQGRSKTLGISAGDHVQWGDCAGGNAPSEGAWRADRLCPASSQ